MQKVSELKEHCERYLRTERWGGSVVLMVVDAVFTSMGLNYFTAVLPKVEEFDKKFVESGRINLKELAEAKEIASYLTTLSEDDRLALRTWARNAKLEN